MTISSARRESAVVTGSAAPVISASWKRAIWVAKRGRHVLPVLEQVGDRRLGAVVARQDLPERRARIVGLVVALDRDVVEGEADAGDLVGRAERSRVNAPSAPDSSSTRGRDAVLDLDRVDARRDAAEQRFERAHQVAEHVVRMDGVAHQHAAELGLPLAAPRHGVIGRLAAPQRLDRADEGLSCKPRVDDRLGLLHAVAEAVLEDRHQLALGGLLDGDDLVDLA